MCSDFFFFLAARHKSPEKLVVSSFLDGLLDVSKWKEVEESFGDRLHERGLTGVTQLAEAQLRNRLLVVFLLTKISSCATINIPLEILKCSFVHRSFLRRWLAVDLTEMEGKEILTNIRSVVLGISDWPFSEGGLLH